MREPAPQDAQVVPTVILGYEFKWNERTNLNVQAYVRNSVYTREQTDLEELLGMKYEYTLGLRHRRENWLLQIGVAWIPHRR